MKVKRKAVSIVDDVAHILSMDEKILCMLMILNGHESSPPNAEKRCFSKRMRYFSLSIESAWSILTGTVYNITVKNEGHIQKDDTRKPGSKRRIRKDDNR
jgi:hypothetical protein